MARIARLNVRSVVSAVRIAEYKPTRFEVVDDDSVPTSGLSLSVISTSPSITSSYNGSYIYPAFYLQRQTNAQAHAAGGRSEAPAEAGGGQVQCLVGCRLDFADAE